jgi:hypothetical protein
VLHKELWQQLDGLDRQRTSQRAKCQYLSDCDCYVITLLNSEYRVDLIKKQVFLVQPGSVLVPAGFLEQLCILVYLINSRQSALSNKLVKAESLAGGAFFFRGPHALPTSKLAEVFGAKPELLYEAGKRFEAKKCDFGDAGDEEFAARGSILFDQTASEQMPLDGLLSAVNLAVDAVTSSVAPDG